MPKKSDANQKQIVETLRCMGVFVFDLHGIGKGCPDLLLAYRGKWYPTEIKTANGKINEAQEKFITRAADIAGVSVLILRSVDQAIDWVKAH
jgi:hypothetical protein